MELTGPSDNGMKQKILITGGSGYIGSVLVEELLKRNFDVTVLDLFESTTSYLAFAFQHQNFKAARSDVLNTEELRQYVAEADVIIPLAALVGAPICALRPELAEHLNFRQISDICNCSSSNQLIIYPNTNSGYGLMDSEEEFCSETSKLNPISIYGETKVRAEDAIISANGIALRLATVFGVSYKMRTDLLVNDFVLRAYKDKSIVLFESHFRRNFIHVRDVARAFIHCIDNKDAMRGEIYNLGLSSANLTKLQLCNKIKELVPDLAILEAELHQDPDKRDYLVSNDKIEATGWSPKYNIEDGIKELLRYYRTVKIMASSNI